MNAKCVFLFWMPFTLPYSVLFKECHRAMSGFNRKTSEVFLVTCIFSYQCIALQNAAYCQNNRLFLYFPSICESNRLSFYLWEQGSIWISLNEYCEWHIREKCVFYQRGLRVFEISPQFEVTDSSQTDTAQGGWGGGWIGWTGQWDSSNLQERKQ